MGGGTVTQSVVLPPQGYMFQSWAQVTVCVEFYIFIWFLWFLPTSHKHAGRWIGYDNHKVWLYACIVPLCWTAMVYSHFLPSVCRRGSRFTVSLTMIKNSNVSHGTAPLEHLMVKSIFQGPNRSSLEVLGFELSTFFSVAQNLSPTEPPQIPTSWPTGWCF